MSIGVAINGFGRMGRLGFRAAWGSEDLEFAHIRYSSHQQIDQTDWSGCDMVIEATGRFRTPELLQAYFDQGVKKVLAAASCTPNCLAPVVQVMPTA